MTRQTYEQICFPSNKNIRTDRGEFWINDGPFSNTSAPWLFRCHHWQWLNFEGILYLCKETAAEIQGVWNISCLPQFRYRMDTQQPPLWQKSHRHSPVQVSVVLVHMGAPSLSCSTKLCLPGDCTEVFPPSSEKVRNYSTISVWWEETSCKQCQLSQAYFISHSKLTIWNGLCLQSCIEALRCWARADCLLLRYTTEESKGDSGYI